MAMWMALMVCVAVFAGAALPQSLRERLARNLLRNSDFEQGLEVWTTHHPWYARGEGLSLWEVDEKIVKEGKRALRVTGKNNRGIAIQDVRPPVPTCRVSGWVRCENLQGAAGILAEFIATDGKWVGGEMVGSVSGTTDWTFVSKEVTLPPDAEILRIDLLTTEPNNGVAWFDAVSVVPVLPPSDGKPPQPVRFTAEPIAGEDGALRIAWTPPTEPDVLTIRVYAEPHPFRAVDDLFPRAILHRRANSFILRGLTVGQQYWVAVVATDLDGMVSAVQPQPWEAKDLRPPEPPFWEAEVVEGKSPQLRLQWRTHPVDSDVVAVEILRKENGRVQVVRQLKAHERQTVLPMRSLVEAIAVVAVDRSGNRSQPFWRTFLSESSTLRSAGFLRGENVRLHSLHGPVTLAPDGWHPTRLPENLFDLLKPLPLSKRGVLYSCPISRPPQGQWGSLVLRWQVPNGCSLQVDVLDEQGRVVMANASDGADLSSITAPTLQLRATFVGDGEKTPQLDAWGIRLQPPRPQGRSGKAAQHLSPPALPLQVWFASPLANIFRDTTPPPDAIALRQWELHVAINEPEAVQLVLRSTQGLAWVQVSVAPEVARWFEVQGRYVGYVPLRANSRATPPEELVRKAPTDFPDPLLALPFVPLRANETQPVFITVRPHRTTKSGTYTVPLVVRTPLGSLTVSLRVRVYPVVFPDRARLWFTNWFRSDHFARFHHVPEWGNEHFQWMRCYAQLMRAHRQNVLLVPLGLVKAVQKADGSFRFDFSRFERFIATFEAEGVAQRLELSHIGGRKTGRWEDPEFVAHPIWAVNELTGEQVEVPLETFLTAVRDYLKATGRLRRAMLHIADEPIPVNVSSWRALSQRVHQAVPDLPRIDAIHVHDLQGHLEVWVPQLNFFAQWLDIYRQRQREGNELWFYTAWVPQGRWTNRLIDYPLIKTRLLHWLNVRYGATGFLHWGWNFWGDVMTGELQSPGDAFIVYPGPNPSLRMEAQRDGIEDAELLWMLAERLAKKGKRISPEEAAALLEPLLRPVLRDFTDYTRDFAELGKVRQFVLQRLSHSP